jgi:putative oxidoreductase
VKEVRSWQAGARESGLLLLRLVVGGFLLPHGLGKLFGWFDGPGLAGFAVELQDFGLPATTPLPLLLALAQTLAGLFVVAGVWTRVSALAAGAFLAATIVLNAENGWFWMHGGIEYPLLWAIAALAVALLGAGRFSLDAVASHHREISP